MSDERQRIEQTERLLRAAAAEAGFTITPDGRIGEADAAQLIGFQPGSLRVMRATFGSGPAHYRLPAGNARVSYRLSDIAAWLESKRTEQGL